MELSAVDREILAEVTADPFASNAAVAEKLGVSTSLVSSRLRALQRDHVSQILAVLDLDHMNQSFCFVFIKTRGRPIEEIATEISTDRMMLMVNELGNHSADLLVLVRFTDFHTLKTSLYEYLSQIRGIVTWQISIVVDVPIFRSEYLTFNVNYEPLDIATNIEYLRQDIPPGMCDETDLQIIANLQLNAHQSINNIARNLGIKPSTARYRINRLKSEDILRFIRVVANSSVGIQASAIFEIDAEIGQVAHVTEALHNRSWLPQLFHCAGRTPIIALIMAESAEEVLRIKRDEVMAIDGIRDVSVTFMTRNYKNDYRWAQVSR